RQRKPNRLPMRKLRRLRLLRLRMQNRNRPRRLLQLGSFRRLNLNRRPLSQSKPRRNQPPQIPIIQQQEPKHQHQVIQECVVRRQNHANLPRRNNEEANQPPPSRQEPQKHNSQLHHQRRPRRRRMEPVRQVLHVIPNPRRQRTILVVLVHRRKVPPFRIAAQQLHQPRLKIDPEPLPLQQEVPRPNRWTALSKSRPQSPRRNKQRKKSSLQQHSIRLIPGKIPGSRHKRQKPEEADKETQPRPRIYKRRD